MCDDVISLWWIGNWWEVFVVGVSRLGDVDIIVGNKKYRVKNLVFKYGGIFI